MSCVPSLPYTTGVHPIITEFFCLKAKTYPKSSIYFYIACRSNSLELKAFFPLTLVMALSCSLAVPKLHPSPTASQKLRVSGVSHYIQFSRLSRPFSLALPPIKSELEWVTICKVLSGSCLAYN